VGCRDQGPGFPPPPRAASSYSTSACHSRGRPAARSHSGPLTPHPSPLIPHPSSLTPNPTPLTPTQRTLIPVTQGDEQPGDGRNHAPTRYSAREPAGAAATGTVRALPFAPWPAPRERGEALPPAPVLPSFHMPAQASYGPVQVCLSFFSRFNMYCLKSRRCAARGGGGLPSPEHVTWPRRGCLRAGGHPPALQDLGFRVRDWGLGFRSRV